MTLPKILDKANYLSASSGKRLVVVLGILPICTCYALIWPSSWAYPSIFLLSIDVLVRPPHSLAFSIHVNDPSYIQTPGLHTDCYPCRIMSSSFSWSLITSLHLLVSFLLPLMSCCAGLLKTRLLFSQCLLLSVALSCFIEKTESIWWDHTNFLFMLPVFILCTWRYTYLTFQDPFLYRTNFTVHLSLFKTNIIIFKVLEFPQKV